MARLPGGNRFKTPNRSRVAYADELPDWLPAWCVEHLGGEPAGVLFRSQQVSMVFGVRLAGGRDVVVKARADDGRAVVELPPYFEALNRDFRYQLTPIGTFCRAISAMPMQSASRTANMRLSVLARVRSTRSRIFCEAPSAATVRLVAPPRRS